MKFISCLFCVLASYICQGSVRVVQHAGTCTWTLERNESRPVPLGRESRDQLLDQVCADLGCGRVYNFTENDHNSTNSSACLTDCSYRERRLFDCIETVGDNCSVVSEVVCGHQMARLAGSAHRCGGRVELWSGGGGWGTVCDDRWDLADADVVCRQMGCGYAVNVSGQGGAFPPATAGPVHLDELMCTGAESSLWTCPVAPDGVHHDCGHKEDAGVVCSEMRAVRLTGGADHCSGKVEIHLNGTWGTVCDTCWDRQTAAMVCSMLGCGTEPQKYTRFEPHLTHNEGPLWYFMCADEHTDLWQCREYVNVKHLCSSSKAAGLVCVGSQGFPSISISPNVTSVTGLATAGTTTGSAQEDFLFPISPELIGCVALSVLLLVMLAVNCVLCVQSRRRKKKASMTLQRNELEGVALNDYREALSLVKIASTGSPVPPKPSGMLASHHGPYQPSHPLPVYMSTFYNSQRHRHGLGNPATGSAVNTLRQESSRNDARAFNGNMTRKHQSLNPSVDSFESSTTSSGEVSFENQKENRFTAEPQQPGGCNVDFDVPPTSPASSSHQRTPRQMMMSTMLDPGHGGDDDNDEDNIYSPVSPESHSSSMGDYDDVLDP